MRGFLALSLLATTVMAQPAPSAASAPLTAGIANPQVLYVTRYDGTYCSGPINTVTAYPIGQCITVTDASGVAVGGFKIIITKAGGQTIANYQKFSSNVCGDAGTTYTQWISTSYTPLDLEGIYNGGSYIPPIDTCTDTKFAGVSFKATLDGTAPTAARPNPLAFPGMKISAYVPGCKNAASFTYPVVVYRSIMNTCYSTGRTTLALLLFPSLYVSLSWSPFSLLSSLPSLSFPFPFPSPFLFFLQS